MHRYALVNTRWMALDIDKADVLEIESQSYHRAWVTTTFEAVLQPENTAGVVCEQSPHEPDDLLKPTLVVGYLVYKVYNSNIHIFSLGVLRDARRAGAGTALIDHVKTLLDGEHDRLTVRVGERNIGSQLFLKECGFMATAILDPVKCKDMQEYGNAYQMEYIL